MKSFQNLPMNSSIFQHILQQRSLLFILKSFLMLGHTKSWNLICHEYFPLSRCPATFLCAHSRLASATAAATWAAAVRRRASDLRRRRTNGGSAARWRTRAARGRTCWRSGQVTSGPGTGGNSSRYHQHICLSWSSSLISQTFKHVSN